MSITITRLDVDDADLVFEWVQRLLIELGEEAGDLGSLNKPLVLAGWKSSREGLFTFAASDGVGRMVGLATAVESFAMYANGRYGIINEMYVAPEFRSAGVGLQLVQSIIRLGEERQWSRIDVTAPESDRWIRTRAFYERAGFTFAGPKLKRLLR